MEIIYKKAASKFLRAANKDISMKMLLAIEGLIRIPPEGDIKTIKGNENQYRLRIGKYRIIYTYEYNKLIISDIGSRGDIYK